MRHRSRAMEIIRRFGSSAVDKIRSRLDDDDSSSDDLDREVATLATGALVAGGSAPTAARADGDYEENLRGYEDFAMWYLADGHPERKRIAAMETALEENDTKFRLTEPCDLGTVVKYLKVLWAPKVKVYTTKSSPKKEFTGREVGYSIANNIMSAAKYADMALVGKTHLRDEVVANIMSEKFRSYKPKQAVAFDVATVVPRVYQAMFAKDFEGRSNPFNTGLQRQMWFTMFMMVLACCARRSLFTTYCPRIDQVDVDTADKDELGLPKFIIIKLERWKGNADGRRWQKVKIRRNYADQRYCPVAALCLWLKTLHSLGVTENGPLFPALSGGHVDFSRASAEAPLEHVTTDVYTAWWQLMCGYVGGDLLFSKRTHAARRSVVKWGARCGSPWMDLQLAGRWTSNSSFMRYWRDGEALRASRDGDRDPINRVWVWKAIQVEEGYS